MVDAVRVGRGNIGFVLDLRVCKEVVLVLRHIVVRLIHHLAWLPVLWGAILRCRVDQTLKTRLRLHGTAYALLQRLEFFLL